ncbi:DUF937 domain-containing protein [Sorangium sp. So ce1000]|uniref:DUF937 domain-containing protein n=1 Tax=Sorangium sp. So ce1000 TaxID=3133325 RepID=UPI003F5F5DC6
MSLLDTTRGLLTPELISAATKGLVLNDESPASVRGAAESSVPTLLTGMAQIAASQGGAAQLFTTITERDYEGLLGTAGPVRVEQVEELSQHGQSMIARLFGERATGMIELISRSSGVGQRCSAAVLGLVAPTIAGVLSGEVRSRGLTAGGLSDLLSRQKQAFKDDPRAPAGLAGLFAPSIPAGGGGVTAAASERPYDAVSPAAPRTPASSTQLPSRYGSPRQRQTREWLLPAVLAAAVLGGLWAFVRERRPERTAAEHTRAAPVAVPPRENVAPPPPQAERPRAEAPRAEPPRAEAPTAASPSEAPPNAPEVVEQLKITAGEMTLPGGKVLSVDEHGSEAELAQYLDAGAADAPKRFTMEGMNFRFGTAALTEASRPKLDALADILDAYPTARVRIEGHTDAVGSAGANRALSLARAEAARGGGARRARRAQGRSRSHRGGRAGRRATRGAERHRRRTRAEPPDRRHGPEPLKRRLPAIYDRSRAPAPACGSRAPAPASGVSGRARRSCEGAPTAAEAAPVLQSQSRHLHSTWPSAGTPNRSAVYFSMSIRNPEGRAFAVQHPLQSESAHMSYTVTSISAPFFRRRRVFSLYASKSLECTAAMLCSRTQLSGCFPSSAAN